MLTLNSVCEIGIWSWGLKLKFKGKIYALKSVVEAWTWSMRLSIDFKTYSKRLEFEVLGAVFLYLIAAANNSWACLIGSFYYYWFAERKTKLIFPTSTKLDHIVLNFVVLIISTLGITLTGDSWTF